MQKTNTINNNRDFKCIYKRGRSTVSNLLVLYYKKNLGEENRLGITVSKKIGNAVVRNRVRRLIKENYLVRETRIVEGVDMVFVARGRAAGASFWEIGAAMDYILKKSRLLK